MSKRVLVYLVVIWIASVTLGWAGEIGAGIGSCEIGGIFGCEWRPRGCVKPMEPTFIVVDRASAQNAISQYNMYVTELDSYNDCIVSEAKRDIDRIADDIAKSAVKKTSESKKSAEYVKTRLNMYISPYRR